MKRIPTLLSLLLLGASLAAQPIPADPAMRVGRLDNGLTYYICPNGNPAGCADFYIAHNVGALQEEDKQDGLAHFLEHMAFNGSRHYPGNSLLTFLAKDGVRFGYNVNAYTTRNETVYNISDVPLVRESFVDSVLLILHDWSCDISCEPKALDDERGVISEEYRMRDDSRARIAALQNALVYKGSKHTKRSVIGSLDVINHFKREEILDFYHKWYRPDLQAIIIVGDFDPDWMEARVRSAFADIPMPENAPAKETYFPPHLDEPLFEDIADKRVNFHALKIFCKQPYPSREERATEAFYKDLYCRNIVSAVLAERLKKASQASSAPVRSAVLTTNEYEPEYFVSLFTVVPREKSQMGAALEFTRREIRRLLVHGISPEEFEVARLAVAQRFHLDRPVAREEVKSSEIVTGTVGHFLKNHPLAHPADLHDIQAGILGEIGYEDIQGYPVKMFQESEIIYSNCYNPEKDPGIAPSAEEMKAILAKVEAEELEPAFLEYAKPDLNVNAPAGTIRKIAYKKGYEVWTLSNGAKVYYRQVDSVKSYQHLAMTYRWDTGVRSYDPEKVTASRFAASYLSRYLGFRGLEKPDYRNSPELAGLGLLVHSFRTESSMSLLVDKGKEENAFKVVYLTLTEPYFGTQLAKTRENQLKSLAKGKNARTLFEERCDREVYGNHPWLQPVDSAAVLAVDAALVEEVFHRAFGDYRNLSVFICTDLDRGLMQDYVCRYVASLTGDYPYRKSALEEPVALVKGALEIQEVQPREGEPATNIYYAFLRREKLSARSLVVSDFLDYILSARYLALIREERGGAYHVGYATEIPDNRAHAWRGVVQFKTRPEIKDLVLQDVVDVMDRMCAEGPTAEEMEMAARYLKKRHAEVEKRVQGSVGALRDRLESAVLHGRPSGFDYNREVERVSARDVQRMAQRFNAGDVLKEIYTEE